MSDREIVAGDNGHPYAVYFVTLKGVPYVSEIGWVIERSGQWYAAAPHTAWTVRQAINDIHAENWTHDADEALRFARKVDAETLIRFVGWQNATATEHIFITSTGGDANRKGMVPICAMCALGHRPFLAEGIKWHSVNGRDPFRCDAP